jgi:transposase-like protein
VEHYPQELKESMVERMLGPGRITPYALSRESGIGCTTLKRWLDQTRKIAGMDSTQDEATPPGRRPQEWTAEERLQAVIEASQLAEEDLGPWMREHGLHSAILARWRAAAMRALGDRQATTAETRRIKQLERDLRRKNKALAETAALLVLSGKAKALWGDEGNDTDRT